jgi:hypothetical protein
MRGFLFACPERVATVGADVNRPTPRPRTGEDVERALTPAKI